MPTHISQLISSYCTLQNSGFASQKEELNPGPSFSAAWCSCRVLQMGACCLFCCMLGVSQKHLLNWAWCMEKCPRHGLQRAEELDTPCESQIRNIFSMACGETEFKATRDFTPKFPCQFNGNFKFVHSGTLNTTKVLFQFLKLHCVQNCLWWHDRHGLGECQAGCSQG